VVVVVSNSSKINNSSSSIIIINTNNVPILHPLLQYEDIYIYRKYSAVKALSSEIMPKTI